MECDDGMEEVLVSWDLTEEQYKLLEKNKAKLSIQSISSSLDRKFWTLELSNSGENVTITEERLNLTEEVNVLNEEASNTDSDSKTLLVSNAPLMQLRLQGSTSDYCMATHFLYDKPGDPAAIGKIDYPIRLLP